MIKNQASASRGFSLVEVLLAMALGLAVLTGAMALFSNAADASYLIAQRGEMQQNARAALNAIHRDLSVAGTGMPQGGVALPFGTGSTASKYACDQTNTCYFTTPAVNNLFPNQRLYNVMPGYQFGPSLVGHTTDAITLAYVDSGLPLNNCALAAISATGNQITVGACMTSPPVGVPGYNDPAVGLQNGDILLFTNAAGNTALGDVTQVQTGGVVKFANADWLNINQSGAASGNIASMGTGSPPAAAVTVVRILLITYFIQTPAGGVPRLMRQVNAQAPAPIADEIESVQVLYDIYNTANSTASANLNTTVSPNSPNEIRAINLAVTARTPSQRTLRGGGLQRISLVTSVSPPNLSFFDRYQ